MAKLAIKLAIAFSLQAVMTVFLYRDRAIAHAPWVNSDFIVFGLPLLMGLAVVAAILFFSFPLMSFARRTKVALGYLLLVHWLFP